MILAKEASTPLPQAYGMTLSESAAVFETDAWRQYQKVQDARRKYDEGMAERLNNVVAAIGMLGRGLIKAFAARTR